MKADGETDSLMCVPDSTISLYFSARYLRVLWGFLVFFLHVGMNTFFAATQRMCVLDQVVILQ